MIITPLQNSLLELYGLVSIIDDHVFGDLKSFKSQFSRVSGFNADVKGVDFDALENTIYEKYWNCCERESYTYHF